MSIFNTIEYYDDADYNMSSSPFVTKIVVLFVVLWILAGLAAFVWSIVCFGRSGTTAQHIVGLLLSMFVGPFYWIYFLAVPGYCRVK